MSELKTWFCASGDKFMRVDNDDTMLYQATRYVSLSDYRALEAQLTEARMAITADASRYLSVIDRKEQQINSLRESMWAASNWIKNCSNTTDAAHELDKALAGQESK
jgi:hypothetical protein